MDIKELKAKVDAAKAALDAKPEDAALKAAYDGAKAAYDAALEDSDDSTPGEQGDDGDDDDSLDESKLDPKTKAYLAKLRRENAKHRTKSKNLGDRLSVLETGLKKLGLGESDEQTAEQKLETLKQQNEGHAFKTALLEAALEHGIAKEDRKYFEFLVADKVAGLEEGEELSDEDIAEIAKSCKKSSGGKIRTSVDDDGAPNPKGKGDVTIEQFLAMGVVEKSEFYAKNPAKYSELFAQAKQKRRI